jgi:signal transduction histidine kinase
MSTLVIAWSMCAAACLMLALLHMLLWLKYSQNTVYLLSSLMAFAACASALLELGLLTTQSLETYRALIRWENLAIFMILVPMVWFVQIYFSSARRWLALAITLLWSLGMLINFVSPWSLTFSAIAELKQLPAFWGEFFTVPSGTENPWKLLADLSSLLILAYVGDATFRSWRHNNQREALIIGSGILLFIISAGIHTPLVDAGIVHTPYMVSFAFLAIVATMSYQLASEAMRSQHYERELQQTRKQLDQLARSSLLGECTTIIAHELNQPLTAILSNAQAARKQLAGNGLSQQAITEILDDIVRDDKRASDIIQRMRAMLQNNEIVREWFDLNEAIRETVRMLAGEFRANNIDLSQTYSPDLPEVYAGRVEIQQVILNLLVNAVRAMKDKRGNGKLVSICTRLSNHEVEVSIEDNAKGLPDDAYEVLFNTIYYKSADGLGMGLTICRRIVETYGGRIWARNADTGGAVFSFSLPVRASTQHSAG